MSKLLQKLDTLGLLLLIAAALYYSVNNIWDKWAIGLALLGGVSIVVGLVANYKQIMLTLGKRSTKYFSNYVVSVALVLGLVAGLNFIGQRHSKRFDLTAIGRFTLAPQTTQILGKLDKDLEIKVFFPGGDYPPMKELLTAVPGCQPPRALRIYRSRQASRDCQAIWRSRSTGPFRIPSPAPR